jgi:S-adenosyl-L-methionine hydrolase (adenosine-forming)
MAIITLTTDWKSNDFYVGAVKGKLLSLFPGATIIDISHQVSLFNTAQAAFVLKNSFFHFPKGSIHIVDVNSEVSETVKHIALVYKGHFFIGADNGGFGLICNEGIEKIIKIDSFSGDECHTFPSLHVFVPAAALLASGGKIEELGTAMTEINRQTPMLPIVDESAISGTVVYIDSYQNVVTNISRDQFDRICRGRQFEILVQSNHYKIRRINKTYNETSSGELLAIFNSAGLLEIAINRGNVAELLNLSINSTVRVKFF